jgi:hypothetical protein
MRGIGGAETSKTSAVVPAQGWDDGEFVASTFAPSHYIRINACRSILPVPVFGSSAMKWISRGYL